MALTQCGVLCFFFYFNGCAQQKNLNKIENTNLFLDARWANTLKPSATCDYYILVKSAINAAVLKDSHLGSEKRGLFFLVHLEFFVMLLHLSGIFGLY